MFITSVYGPEGSKFEVKVFAWKQRFKITFWIALFFKKWAKPGLFLVYFRPFLNTMTMFDYKKHRWFAWDLNLGRQDGRRRGIH